jgi:hypothetical protein
LEDQLERDASLQPLSESGLLSSLQQAEVELTAAR